jgi:hypothetical protein
MALRKGSGLSLEKMAKMELHNLFCQPKIIRMRWMGNITCMVGTDACKIKNKDKAVPYHLQQQDSVHLYWLNVIVR